ncbi:MAG: Crp/Fnr family transcriptional regulator [Myxococcales bacterium]|nr:Crp/Fnr family transcriptional regulator [Myxococcales bacterium]
MALRQFIERASALSGAEPALLDRMAKAATIRTLARNGVAWRAGEPACGLTLIKSGLIKVIRPTPPGRSTICGLFGAPQTLGSLALLRGDAHLVDAVAATNQTTMITIPGRLVLAAVDTNPRLALSLACSVHHELSALHEKVDVLSAGSVEARLATLLLQLYEQFGDEMSDGTPCIPLSLSRRELADLVSTSFETAIRTMTSWDRQGVLETTPEGFMIRRLVALREIAGLEGRTLFVA